MEALGGKQGLELRNRCLPFYRGPSEHGSGWVEPDYKQVAKWASVIPNAFWDVVKAEPEPPAILIVSADLLDKIQKAFTGATLSIIGQMNLLEMGGIKDQGTAAHKKAIADMEACSSEIEALMQPATCKKESL
jgi:hypothetical protein